MADLSAYALGGRELERRQEEQERRHRDQATRPAPLESIRPCVYSSRVGWSHLWKGDVALRHATDVVPNSGSSFPPRVFSLP
eukprot:scaffold46989_cov62-Phaeocystis_antarctica.AAC.3